MTGSPDGLADASNLWAEAVGVAWLDIVDNWTNQYNLLIVGVMECVLVGWFFNPVKVLDEINKNTLKFKMPKWWFVSTIKVIAPVTLAVLCVMNMISLFRNGGLYQGYSVFANVTGWTLSIAALLSGFILNLILNKKPRLKALAVKAGENFGSWDDMEKVDVHAPLPAQESPAENNA